jgi:hypothetical protein
MLFLPAARLKSKNGSAIFLPLQLASHGFMTKDSDPVHSYAKAEAYLNSTLAYQAAIAVHHLREEFGLSVSELRLSVAPEDPLHPRIVLVTCTIANLQAEAREVKVRVDSLTGTVQAVDGHSVEHRAG